VFIAGLILVHQPNNLAMGQQVTIVGGLSTLTSALASLLLAVRRKAVARGAVALNTFGF
jgi:hypothetical protein